MAAGASSLAMLAVFSGLSMNLVLQFGLGLRELVMAEYFSHDENAGRKQEPAVLGILCITILLLWLFFSFTRSVLPMGLLEYILLFPASSLLFSALEYLLNRFVLKKQQGAAFGNAFTGGALAGTALFVTLSIAGGLLEAAVLSLGFTAGIALAVTIAGEIRRRSQMEAVPRFLRGGPLSLVTLGLLSLVFSSAALKLFEVLGG